MALKDIIADNFEVIKIGKYCKHLLLSKLKTCGEVFEIWDKGYKVKKKIFTFFSQNPLVYLGTSPDTIGKIS